MINLTADLATALRFLVYMGDIWIINNNTLNDWAVQFIGLFLALAIFRFAYRGFISSLGGVYFDNLGTLVGDGLSIFDGDQVEIRDTYRKAPEPRMSLKDRLYYENRD